MISLDDRRYHVVLNPHSGGAIALGLTAESLKERFDAAGYVATVDADCERPLEERIERAVAGDADTIVAAGGDGTVTAIAHSILDTAKTLAVLPTGTANLLARDLSIPLDLDKAIAMLSEMHTRRIDVGEVNGRSFLHNVTVGQIPGIPVAREQIRGRSDLAATLGFAQHFLRRLARAKRLAVETALDGSPARAQRVQAVSVANNAYDEGFGHVFSRARLDAGRLNVYTFKHLTLGDVVRLTLGMVLGRWQKHEALTIESACDVTLRLKRPSIMTMLDGEVEKMDLPLNFRLRPLALSVLAPAPAELAKDDTDQPEFVVGI